MTASPRARSNLLMAPGARLARGADDRALRAGAGHRLLPRAASTAASTTPSRSRISRCVFDPLYAGIFLNSARIAGAATLLALLIGYPAAYAIAAAPRPAPAAPPVPRGAAVLVELPDPHLCLDRAPQPRGADHAGPRAGSATRASRRRCSTPRAPSSSGWSTTTCPSSSSPATPRSRGSTPSCNEASRDLGASAFTTFRRVTLPLTAARHRRRRGVRLRAVDRQFRHARAARRRPLPDDRQPRLRPVPHRQRLAVRRGAVDGADRADDRRSWRCRPVAPAALAGETAATRGGGDG